MSIDRHQNIEITDREDLDRGSIGRNTGEGRNIVLRLEVLWLESNKYQEKVMCIHDSGVWGGERRKDRQS